jgi:mannose-6-phosphate isomerase-like protein (cupin superfamily)
MELSPDQRLELDHCCDQVIAVDEGVVYVVLADDEVVLTAGDSITIPAGAPRRAWNAGDEAAQVEVHAGHRLRLAA